MAATLSLLFFKAESASIITKPFLANAYVDGELKYQLITLGLAGIVLLFTFLLAPTYFRKFFSLGKINAPVEPVKLIGLTPKPEEGWLQIGRNFAVIISVVTFVFIYLQVIRGNSIETHNLRYLPWILVFAITNSFVEEMITRFAVVSALDGLLSRQLIYLTSAAIFGSVHYFGTPGGIAGVALAGFLGWLLAKSIYETRGIFWAWSIHCLQDVIIFTGLFFMYL
jgi:membrane protease YdiL (CAAX protease family)